MYGTNLWTHTHTLNEVVVCSQYNNGFNCSGKIPARIVGAKSASRLFSELLPYVVNVLMFVSFRWVLRGHLQEDHRGRLGVGLVVRH